jgi:hypothetical protein
MHILYLEPLKRAWARTRSLLFRPARPETWFVLGFTVWLARLWDNAGLGTQSWSNHGLKIRNGDVDWAHIEGTFFDEVGALGALVVLGLVALGLVVALVITWLSSRAEPPWSNRGTAPPAWATRSSSGASASRSSPACWRWRSSCPRSC